MEHKLTLIRNSHPAQDWDTLTIEVVGNRYENRKFTEFLDRRPDITPFLRHQHPRNRSFPVYFGPHRDMERADRGFFHTGDLKADPWDLERVIYPMVALVRKLGLKVTNLYPQAVSA